MMYRDTSGHPERRYCRWDDDVHWYNDLYGSRWRATYLRFLLCSPARCLRSQPWLLRSFQTSPGRVSPRRNGHHIFDRWIVLGHLGAILGSWGHLEPSWGHLRPSWSFLGPSWGHLGAILGPSWGHLGAILGPFFVNRQKRPFLAKRLGPFCQKRSFYLVFLTVFQSTAFSTIKKHCKNACFWQNPKK